MPGPSPPAEDSEQVELRRIRPRLLSQLGGGSFTIVAVRCVA